MLLAELHNDPANDMLVRLHFDGSFEFVTTPFVVVGSHPESEKAAQTWLNEQLAGKTKHDEIIETMLQTGRVLRETKSFTAEIPSEDHRRQGWRDATKNRTLEIAFLDRKSPRQARFAWLNVEKLKSVSCPALECGGLTPLWMDVS